MLVPQQTQAVDPALIKCWASVVDGGPTTNQRWVLRSLGQDRRVGGGGGLSEPTRCRVSDEAI